MERKVVGAQGRSRSVGQPLRSVTAPNTPRDMATAPERKSSSRLGIPRVSSGLNKLSADGEGQQENAACNQKSRCDASLVERGDGSSESERTAGENDKNFQPGAADDAG